MAGAATGVPPPLVEDVVDDAAGDVVDAAGATDTGVTGAKRLVVGALVYKPAGELFKTLAVTF